MLVAETVFGCEGFTVQTQFRMIGGNDAADARRDNGQIEIGRRGEKQLVVVAPADAFVETRGRGDRD